MKLKLKSILAVALCAVGLSAFAAEPDAVQLWENGPYFATCNVGAEAPQEYGWYFWWGDTVGYKRNAANNGWVSVADGTTSIKFIDTDATANPTYNHDGNWLKNNGWIDDSGNLVVSDDTTNRDAARKHLGTAWRMMTYAELLKLVSTEYCESTWTTDWEGTGTAGYVVKGKGSYASNSVFFPAAGYGYESDLCDAGSLGYGYYWSSTSESGVSNGTALSLYFGSDESLSQNASVRFLGLPVRAVRDTPKQEISAESAEGWLDLTVGDRVAEDEETIVVDPAWGKAETATVKLQNGWNRTYTCASNDLWDTTALTPGRYGLALRAGEGETGVLYGAFFWKTGDDWVVLDLPPYSTEGIEFQADKTYLVLGQYEFAPEKTLTVLDGAKFEYGEGAGFKGGQLDLPKRYGTNVVEGGLYQIVEKIKGCADNPWVVGDNGKEPLQLVEAYTNGTELVIVGTGTVTGLKEIPGAVVAGVETITVAEPTVTGVEENAFAGYSGFKVTLPDNWQGELPKGGSWYGATGVELTRMPLAVKNVKVQQRYPWNGLVDVNFDLMGEGSVKVKVQVTVDGKKLKNPTVTGETKFDLGEGGEQKGLKLTWNANADFGDAEKHEKIKVKLTVEKAEVD